MQWRRRRRRQADLHDSYVPYNKPGSIKHWLEHANVEEEFVFFIDADMARARCSPLTRGTRR